MDELFGGLLRLVSTVTPLGQWVVIMYFLERICGRGFDLWQAEKKRQGRDRVN